MEIIVLAAATEPQLAAGSWQKKFARRTETVRQTGTHGAGTRGLAGRKLETTAKSCF